MKMLAGLLHLPDLARAFYSRLHRPGLVFFPTTAVTIRCAQNPRLSKRGVVLCTSVLNASRPIWPQYLELAVCTLVMLYHPCPSNNAADDVQHISFLYD